jgi:hypothetical protein
MELNGTTDWAGYWGAMGGVPGYYPNDTFTLTFNIDKGVDEGGTGPAIAEAVRIDWDFVRNAPVRHVLKYGANGVLTYGAQTTEDSSTPSPVSSRDCDIKMGDALAVPSLTTFPRILTASLTMFSDIQRYADSSTTGGYQRAPGIKGWMVDLLVHTEDPSDTALPILNGDKQMQMYVTTSTFYDISWLKFKRVGELELDIGGQKYITTKFRGMGTAYADLAGTWTEGQFIKPDTTDWWPPV